MKKPLVLAIDGCRHLLTEELNFKSIPGRIKAAAMLGAPYGRELTESEEMAMEQAKQIVKDLIEQGGPKSGTIKDSSGKEIALEETQIVALIAYIQRVGVDYFATDTVPEVGAAEGSETEVVEPEVVEPGAADTEANVETEKPENEG